jgi:nucleoside-diphosphate-sugar epimerase
MANFTIFGSKGFIGSNLVRSLESSGHVVFRPLRDEPIESNENLGHVIYCCGITNGDFRKRSSEIVDAHVVNANRVLAGAQFESFLYLSSARIYDEMTSTFEEQKIPVTLDTASGFYNATKLLGESLVLNHEGPNCRVARLSYVIDVKEDIFFSPILNQINGQKVSIPWHEKTLKDFVVLDDVLHLVPMIAQNGKKSLYNVASGVNYSMSKVGQLLTSVLDVEVEFSQTEPMRNPSRIDIERITTEFGFKPVDAMDYAKKMISSSVTQ